MAQFVHLTFEHLARRIRRSGIAARRMPEPYQGFERIVFAMPVTPNYYLSHQWLRELKRRGQRTIVGVYFRVPDDQPVLIGHYGQHHQQLTANAAVGLVFNSENVEGYEVILPRKIEPGEIQTIRPLPQVLGWRYYPSAHGRKPCGCPACQGRGEIKSRAIVRRMRRVPE